MEFIVVVVNGRFLNPL